MDVTLQFDYCCYPDAKIPLVSGTTLNFVLRLMAVIEQGKDDLARLAQIVKPAGDFYALARVLAGALNRDPWV